MPLYKEIAYYEPTKKIRTEQDLREAIKELRANLSGLDISQDIYEPALKEALEERKENIEISNGVSRVPIRRIGIKQLVSAMQEYESLRNNLDFKQVLGPDPRPLDEILGEV